MNALPVKFANPTPFEMIRIVWRAGELDPRPYACVKCERPFAVDDLVALVVTEASVSAPTVETVDDGLSGVLVLQLSHIDCPGGPHGHD